MAIRYWKEKQIFSIDTKNTTYQMKVDSCGFLLHLYYGAKVNGAMDYLLTYADRGFSGNPAEAGADRTYSLDVLPQEYPTWGTGDYRNAALLIQNADHSESCKLQYAGHTIKKGKYNLSGLPAVYAEENEAETLEIYMEDCVSNLKVTLLYGVVEQLDIITRSVIIENHGSENIIIEKAGSACLELLPGQYDLLSFCGRHTMERTVQRKRIGYGSSVFESRRGTSSHQYNPAFILADVNATEDCGNCYGIAFVYSGGFRFETEKDPYDQVRTVMSIQPEQFAYPLNPGERFVVPETIFSFSQNGFGALSHNYHNCINHHVIRRSFQKKMRPVLINSWEAAYFDFTGETMLELAKNAADVGIDLVVMDDGWFGKRDDDNSGLGDWEVNEEKLGCSLGTLIEKINELGVDFGIWIEPEMISEDSTLYRNHPDWVLQIPGRSPVRSRNQLVLDFSRKDVRDYIFASICKVLDQGNITYVKWDMNRSISDVYSHVNVRGTVLHDYVVGVYDFLEQMIQRYPELLIEGCSGGGGRFDIGMLYYTPQIWCSDNTDAIDRTKIQYGTSFFYPASAVGSHVSAVPNHQTGRITSLKTRAVVAMAGTFGYELNLQILSAEEKEEIKEQVAVFKKQNELIQQGTYYRLTNPMEDAMAAWLFVSENKKHALFNVVVLDKQANAGVTFIKLKGLLEGSTYISSVDNREYAADGLMEAGFPIPSTLGEYEAYQVEFIWK
jgi:alpha-galactosidase